MTSTAPSPAIPSVDDMLTGSGKGAKFPEVGTVVRGTIAAVPQSRQATKMGSGELEFYPSGDPVIEVPITLQTDEREDDNDDGKRTVYASRRLWGAIKSAVQASGGKLEVGGTLAVEYYGDGEPPQPGFHAPKLYRAEYKQPALDTSSIGAPAQQAAPAPAPSGPLL